VLLIKQIPFLLLLHLLLLLLLRHCLFFFFSVPPAAWSVYLFQEVNTKGATVEYSSSGSRCIRAGGNASYHQDTGKWDARSFSGTDCRGSSTRLSQKTVCYRVPFGSVSVECHI
jgi:hypothetical protein